MKDLTGSGHKSVRSPDSRVFYLTWRVSECVSSLYSSLLIHLQNQILQCTKAAHTLCRVIFYTLLGQIRPGYTDGHVGRQSWFKLVCATTLCLEWLIISYSTVRTEREWSVSLSCYSKLFQVSSCFIILYLPDAELNDSSGCVWTSFSFSKATSSHRWFKSDPWWSYDITSWCYATWWRIRERPSKFRGWSSSRTDAASGLKVKLWPENPRSAATHMTKRTR